jgi:hypothetical protein
MELMLPQPHRNWTRRSVLGMCVAGLGLPACAAMKNTATAYGTKVTYSQGTVIHFPDFDVTYLGSRKVPSKVYPRGFTYEDFRVSKDSRSTTVSWTSGTGLVVPCAFKFDGQKYQLMLAFGGPGVKLKNNELIVAKV